MRTNSIEADRSVSFSEGMVEVVIYEQARILPVIWAGGGGGHQTVSAQHDSGVWPGPGILFFFSLGVFKVQVLYMRSIV